MSIEERIQQLEANSGAPIYAIFWKSTFSKGMDKILFPVSRGERTINWITKLGKIGMGHKYEADFSKYEGQNVGLPYNIPFVFKLKQK